MKASKIPERFEPDQKLLDRFPLRKGSWTDPNGTLCQTPLGQESPIQLGDNTLQQMVCDYEEVYRERSSHLFIRRFVDGMPEDDIFDESLVKRYKDFSLLGIVDVTPQDKELQELGVIERVDILVKVPTSILIAAELYDSKRQEPKFGKTDVIVLPPKGYGVFAVKPTGFIRGYPFLQAIVGRILSASKDPRGSNENQ